MISNANYCNAIIGQIKVNVAISFAICAFQMGWSVYKWYKGKITLFELKKELIKIGSEVTGAAACGSFGWVAGGMIGSSLGPWGMLIGGIIGALFGGFAGSVAGDKVGDLIADWALGDNEDEVK